MEEKKVKKNGVVQELVTLFARFFSEAGQKVLPSVERF